MKRGDISHWNDIDSCYNLLFFAQLINELLFDFSIPSNRISTLNSHYLCLDALSAIYEIEYNGVPEGTLKPIMEELYSELQKDPVFDKEVAPMSFFVKVQDGKHKICNNVAEMNFFDLKRTANSLKKVFFENNSYYESTKNKIIDIVKKNETEKQQELFRLTKSILTDLMNSGYSIKYLYTVMNQVFWNPQTDINSPDRIQDFFDCFTWDYHNFVVVFKVKKDKDSKIIKYIDGLDLQKEIEIETNSIEGKNFLRINKDEFFLQIEEKAKDPFTASENARKLLENNTAVYRLFDHEYKYKIWTEPCGIFDENGEFYKYMLSKRPVQHIKTPSEKQIIESVGVANKAMSKIGNDWDYQDYISLLSAIRFHSHSLNSYAEENQLLDLWAIFETLLDIRNKHTSDRIQQICILLVPLLKRKYLFSLFDQLAGDIRNYDEGMFARIVEDATDKKDVVQKVCEFVLLPEMEFYRDIELAKMVDFPLLRERIRYYNDKLSTPKLVHQYVEKHADRVRWQVMRIYRNRNLIVHNGDSMPYLSLLIENLHSYVDDFLAYTIHSLANGNNIESMCQEVYIAECKWNERFAKSKDPITRNQIKEMLSI